MVARADQVPHRLRLTQRVGRRKGFQVVGDRRVQSVLQAFAVAAAQNGRAGLGVKEVPLTERAARHDVGAEAAAQGGEREGVEPL